MTETFAARIARENAEFNGLADDLLKLADAALDASEPLRKFGATGPVYGMTLVAIEARQLAARLHRLASAPLPLPLAALAAAGEA